MRRIEFLKICGLLGVGLPAVPWLGACQKEALTAGDFKGKVLVIGAGAGGLSAAFLLQKLGVDFTVLEASSSWGGRMKVNTEFADFPIPVGAEWLHTSPNVFQEIVNDETVEIKVKTVAYSSLDSFAFVEKDRIYVEPLVDSDLKFAGSSWYNFYEDYIIPSVFSQILVNQEVLSIDYSGEKISVQTGTDSFQADRVILAVPLKILQNQRIQFFPMLPDVKARAIKETQVWDGFKAFFEFSEKFYHTQLEFSVLPETAGQKLFYDASYGQNTSQHILGIFSVGLPASDYASMSGEFFKNDVLAELDKVYDGKASKYYIRHVVQNWNDEPFIQGGYLSDYADWKMVRELGKPVAGKLYFGGGEFTDGEDWVAVHVAAQSAHRAVKEMLG